MMPRRSIALYEASIPSHSATRPVRCREPMAATMPIAAVRISHAMAPFPGDIVMAQMTSQPGQPAKKGRMSQGAGNRMFCMLLEAQYRRSTPHAAEVWRGSRWQDTGHVFATSIGTPIEAARVTRSFALALERAGLPHIRFHDLRHATATFLLAQGFTLEDVKNLLGHSSIVLTSNTYGHVLEQRQQQVARGMDAVLGR